MSTMRSENEEPRSRSGAEVAFDVMRALATARLLWGHDAALPLDALPELVQAPTDSVASALERLCDEGIVEVSGADATVRFTAGAVRDMCANLGGGAAALTGTAVQVA